MVSLPPRVRTRMAGSRGNRQVRVPGRHSLSDIREPVRTVAGAGDPGYWYLFR